MALRERGTDVHGYFGGRVHVLFNVSEGVQGQNMVFKVTLPWARAK